MKFNFKIQHSTRQMKDMSQIDLKFDSEQNAFGCKRTIASTP